MTCVVVDDNKMARTALKKLITQVSSLVLLEECSNPTDAYNFLLKESVDLLFLDVEMPGMTGIELIKNLGKRPVTILITSKTDYAVEAYELSVADYIIKPVTLPRFMLAVSKAKELIESKNQKVEFNGQGKDYIFVRSNSILTKIRIDEITYVQALGDYINIYAANNRYTVHITLKAFEEKLPSERFYRLHRSFLIALNHIDKVEDGTAYIGQHPVPIGEQYKKELLRRINLI